MWIVYYVEGKTVQFGSTRTYVGSTEVRDGETLKMAADRRVDAHKDVGNSGRGAAFLRCCGDIKLLSFSQFENRLEARADELWKTIEYFRESEREPARASVRGGPYSTPTLSPVACGEIAHLLSGEKLSKRFTPLGFRHLEECCFACGLPGHMAKNCTTSGVAPEENLTWNQNPAKYQSTMGPGCWWDASRRRWRTFVADPKNAGKRKCQKSVCVYVKGSLAGGFTVNFNDKIFERHSTEPRAVEGALTLMMVELSRVGVDLCRRPTNYNWTSGNHALRKRITRISPVLHEKEQKVAERDGKGTGLKSVGTSGCNKKIKKKK